MKSNFWTVIVIILSIQAGWTQSGRVLDALASRDPDVRAGALTKIITDGMNPEDWPLLLDPLEKSESSDTELRKTLVDIVADIPLYLMMKVKSQDLKVATADVPDSLKSRVFSVMSELAEDSKPRTKERAYFALSAFNQGDEKVEKYLAGRWKLESTENGKAAVVKALGNTGVSLPESKIILTSAFAADSEPLTTTALETLIFLNDQGSLLKADDFLPEVVPLLLSSNTLIQNRAIRFVEKLGMSAKMHIALLQSTAARLPAGETKMLLEQVIKNLNK